MYKEVIADINYVDILLDFKLDIVFNSAEVLSMEKNEMEKLVNYCEEEIRENIENYRIVYEENKIVAAFHVDDYSDGKMVDFVYVMPDCRRLGIGTYIINEIVNNNYKALYAWVYKENEIAIHMMESNAFVVEEETEYKYLMKNLNEKKENIDIKLQLFKNDVDELAKKYGITYKLDCSI